MTPLAILGRTRSRVMSARVGGSSDAIKEANATVNASGRGLNRNARQMAIAIGFLESCFGLPGLHCGDSWQKEDGTPSYNWGALVGSGTDGSIEHKDNAPDGTPVVYNFKAFNTMGEGFSAFLSTWARSDVSGDKTIPHEETVLDAATRGDAYNVAKTMYAHRYYGGTPTGAGAWHPSMGSDDERRIQTYANAIVGAARTVAGALGESMTLRSDPVPAQSSGVPWWGWPVVVALVGGIFYRVLRW